MPRAPHSPGSGHGRREERRAATTAERRSLPRECEAKRPYRRDGAGIWLRTPPGKHGPTTLNETHQKGGVSQTVRVHEWDLSAIPLERLRAYSQPVVNRPPAETARLSHDQKVLELCCFLSVTLLELTRTSPPTWRPAAFATWSATPLDVC